MTVLDTRSMKPVDHLARTPRRLLGGALLAAAVAVATAACGSGSSSSSTSASAAASSGSDSSSSSSAATKSNLSVGYFTGLVAEPETVIGSVSSLAKQTGASIK
ncbi:MAG: hypothetical protein ABSH51_30180, partial [Solirubrobacteraceae bacterium]